MMRVSIIVAAGALATARLASGQQVAPSDSARLAQCMASQMKQTMAAMKESGMDHAKMDHAAHMAAMRATCSRKLPTQPGQAAFGAIGEVVRLLKEDSTTDWSKVNIEALRQHLIDMDDVMMHAIVAQQPVDGGAVMSVTGTGRTVAAIRRVAANHSMMLEQESGYKTAVVEIPNGVRLTVTANDSKDAKQVAQIRGLGFAGLFTEGDHHAIHHMAIARGENPHHMP